MAIILCCDCALFASPVSDLLERIDKGASKKFKIEYVTSDKDFFELDQKGDKVVVRGNDYVSVACGINWYLKYYAGIHLTWNCMKAELPDILPPVNRKERRDTDIKYRYDFNYCTHSYTMAFWDWDRWEQEIDWMALHGINLPLAITGTETVWFNVMQRLGYSRGEIDEFISGPAFFAWWLMNNLEGWGGPNSDNWYADRAELQRKIMKRMKEFGIEPVLPGYYGMLPHDAKEKLGIEAVNTGLWCNYTRPSFLQPEDENFEKIASLYYEEMEKLYGKANFYSMDPFHEGGNTQGVNMDAAGQIIMKTMKAANPEAVWVIQAWGENPRHDMIKNLKSGDLLVLDLYSESRPQWGYPKSLWYRKDGFEQHDWTYCMLLNFGGNVGLFGKMDQVINRYYLAKSDLRASKTLKGVGITAEGIENNPVMYELLMELPWRDSLFTKEEWLKGYIQARYGKYNDTVMMSWLLLANSIYNCPDEQVQQGCHESVFCAKPAKHIYQVSSWSEMKDYYNPDDVIKAAALLLSVADEFRGSNNFEYDLVDIIRQAVAEQGRKLNTVIEKSYDANDKDIYKTASDKFLKLILLQDELLGTRSEFTLGRWINMAKSLGKTEQEKSLLEWNARVQITTWGNREAAITGGLADYGHKEWNGLLKDFYYMRWKTYFDYKLSHFNDGSPDKLDYYPMEEEWTKQQNVFSAEPQGDCINTAKSVFNLVFGTEIR